jgi:ABC-2 type transport system ATP-binding protein
MPVVPATRKVVLSSGAAGGSIVAVVVEEQAVVFEDVTKTFADRPAVRELGFRVPKGVVYGLLGPNGAGKTTSIRMLMAILQPDSGRIRVFGSEPTAALKDRIGYLPEERGLYPGMKVIDNLVFFGTIHGLPPADARAKASRWLDRLSLSESADQKLQELSKGNQQKIQFIATVSHEPDLLVLDEPFTGLDPVNQDLMRMTILELADKGTTVILSTHLMDEVERLCSELTLIDSGEALVEGSLDDVKRRYGTDTIRIDVTGDASPIESHPDVVEFSRLGHSLEVRLVEGCDPSAFLASVASRISVRRFEIQAPSLHNIFVRLVSADQSAASPRPDSVAPTRLRGAMP